MSPRNILEVMRNFVNIRDDANSLFLFRINGRAFRYRTFAEASSCVLHDRKNEVKWVPSLPQPGNLRGKALTHQVVAGSGDGARYTGCNDASFYYLGVTRAEGQQGLS